MMTKARVINLHWDDIAHSIQEATIEVEFPTGDTQLFVVPIVRMTNRLPARRNATENKDWTDDKK
jgi:hypothetical protein